MGCTVGIALGATDGLGVAMRTPQTLFELTDVSTQLTSFHMPADRTKTQSSLLLMLLGSPLFQFV